MTKLFVPRAQPDLVFRSRILERLDEGLRRKLTLVSAPPGFGKTTLVSSWYQRGSLDDAAFAWLSIDERDNEVTTFLAYLIEALHMANPSIGGDPRTLIQSASHLPLELIFTELINSISALPNRIVLVLDDYHLIDNAEIHEAMDYLIEHLPSQLHIVLTCRADPPLALPRLRGRGEMIDIRASDLRFDLQETESFLQTTLVREVSAEDVAELEKRTEGWVAGLQLAAISMSNQVDMHDFISSFSGDHPHIFDYLVDEALNLQPVDVQDFLLQTSLFSQFSADLCDAITGRNDSHTVIDYLVRSNIFILSLDSERRWFRYHHLFADLLRRKLRQAQPDFIPELRRRASVWFDEHDDHIEAIWQAINGEHWDRVKELFKRHERTLFNQGQSKAILRMLGAMPEEIVQSSPWLIFMRSASLDLNGETERSLRDLEALEKLLDHIEDDPSRANEYSTDEWHWLRGSVARTRAFVAILENDYAATLQRCDETLQYFPESAYDVRALTLGIRAQALWLTGNLDGAAAGLQETIEMSKLEDAAAARLVGLLGLGSIEVEWGHLDRAGQLYSQAIDYAESHKLAEWQYTGRILSFQSEVHYERNELPQARELAQRGRELVGHWASSHAADISYLHLARVLYAQGDLEGARAMLRQSPPYSNLGPGYAIVAQVEALQALLDLEAGDQRQLSVIEPDLLIPVDSLIDRIWLWTPALKTRGQILNALDRYDEAVSLLAPLFDICLARGWARQAVQTGAVLALSYEGVGAQSKAMEAFDKALAIAAPSGLLRSIVDAGQGVEKVIQSALDYRRKEGGDTLFPAQLLAVVRGTPHNEPGAPATSNQSLFEPLSEREIEVLQLIAAGYTNSAIADELYVVVGTIKAHAHNIYGKLGVRNRTQAINRGRELGLVG